MQETLEKGDIEAYDIIKLEADGIRGPAEAKDEDFVERISDDRVHVSLL